MPKEISNCHPDDWLGNIQSSDFFKSFRQYSKVISIDIDPSLNDSILELAKNESDRLQITITPDSALRIIVFRYLYGSPAIRAMKQSDDGLFSPRINKASNAIATKQSISNLVIPERLCTDMTDLIKCHPCSFDTVNELAAHIVKRFVLGYIKPNITSRPLADVRSPKIRYNNKDDEPTFGFSQKFKQYLEAEAALTKSSMSQLMLDRISEIAYGYSGRNSLAQPGLKSVFSKPFLVPVCNSSDRFGLRASLGKNTEKISLGMPMEFSAQLDQFMTEYQNENPWIETKRGPFVRDILHTDFFGNLYMFKNLRKK